MAITPLPLQYLTANESVEITSAQERMESGSDVHVTTIGFNPVIEKHTLNYFAPKAYIASLRELFCYQDNLVGYYSVTDDLTGATVHWQPEGGFSYSPSGNDYWSATITMRRV